MDLLQSIISQENLLLLNPSLENQTKEYLRAQSLPYERNFQIPHIWVASSGSSAQNQRDLKLMALSYKALRASAQAVNQHLQVNFSDRWLNILPTFHVGSLGIFFRSLEADIEFINQYQAGYKWDVHEFYRSLTKYRISLTSLVPTQIFDLVQAELKSPEDLRAIVVGGSSLSNEVYIKARNLGWPLLPSFGMTELCSQVATASLDSLKSETPHLQILKHIQIKTDENKNVQIQSPALMSLVLKNREGRSFVEHYGPGDWYQTQDKGFVQNNELIILGRNDEVVKILGENVNVAFLRKRFETVIFENEIKNQGEFHWALVPKDDPRCGKKLVLYYENAKDDRGELIQQEQIARLQKIFNDSVMPFERITELCALAKIPRSDLGKILYGELLVIANSKI